MNYLITIIGPTAIGKTALSIALAQHFNCEIVSCDSRQFFKEMTIGTAVPSVKELASATHHFIQNKTILETYSVGTYEKEALLKLDELFLKNNIQILVGGSGLYVDAILKGFDTFPAIESSVREEVTVQYEQFGISYLQEKLKELDPIYFDILTKQNSQTLLNKQRMMRFVEVCLGTTKPYSSFLEKEKNTRNFTPIIIGLEAPREVIYNRINQRVVQMMNDGLLDEANKLYQFKELNALQTVGYKELFDYLDTKITLEFAIEEIKKNTRRFSKRQLTWFKRTENTIWLDYLTPTDAIINLIQQKINNANS